uniref:Uncharacterized protein n=1 Tax=Octopus bimaculoides TaxID=37653 RepID=A0A0L8FMQ2_OCTBM
MIELLCPNYHGVSLPRCKSLTHRSASLSRNSVPYNNTPTYRLTDAKARLIVFNTISY